MRITNNILTNNLLRNLESAQGKIDELQNQMATGLRINKPSDDPVGILNVMRLKGAISSTQQWKTNADEAITYMKTEDSILDNITSMLQRARELSVQGANGALSIDDSSAVADEVEQIAEQLKVLGNTKIGNRYVFSGTATNKELFPSDGSPTEINEEDVAFEVGNNVVISISVNGKRLFGDASTGIVPALNDLVTSLRTKNTSGIERAMGALDDHISNVISVRADLGARTNRMISLSEQLESTIINLQSNLGDLRDLDMAKAITDLTNQQNVYQASLAVGAKIIQPSLIDFLR